MKIESAEFVRSATRSEQFVRDGRPEVAFVGRSNVGKSTILNRLLQKKGLARTSSTPGRTQAVNYFMINNRFYFVDLPGYGYAKAPKQARREWAVLMDDYFQHWQAERALLVQLVDGKVGATDLDLQARDYFESLEIDPWIVATKIDKVPRSRRAKGVDSIRRRFELPAEEKVIPVSAVSGEGVRQVWKGILAFLDDPSNKPQTMGMS